MGSDTENFGFGQLDPNDFGSDFNVTCFIVRQMMAQMDTMKLVQVKAVTGGGGAIAAAGTVDVLPLVNQIDGNNNATPHGTVYGIPWWRLQGGDSAVICDPVVGDIGYVSVADRDISSVKTNKAQANPGSNRKFNISDGIYVGGTLNDVPVQYLLLNADGVKLVDRAGNSVVMASGGTTITDKNNNRVVMATAGITITDKNNNVITMNSTGIDLTDKSSNHVQLTATGAKITDLTGNVINMTAAGIALTPNGVPVTVTGTLVVNGGLQLSGSITAIGGTTYTGNIVTSGNIQTSGDITAGLGTGDQIGMRTHTHQYTRPTGSSTLAQTVGPTAGT